MRRLRSTTIAAGLGTFLVAANGLAQAPLIVDYDNAADYEVASGQFQIDVNVVPSVARRTALQVFTGNGQDGPLTTVAALQSVNPATALAGNPTAGSTVIQVGTANLFGAGDLLLIVQMQGFDATSGDQTPILSPGNVGRFELVRVQATAGVNVTLTAGLTRSYQSTGDARAQVVLVPEYTDVTISAGTRLTPAANWAGGSGGIVALAASGTLNVIGDIDASASGFRGGPVNPISNAGCSINALDFDGRAGRKGEGIDRRAFNDDPRRFGRGNYANGGGGGNPHNAGGGGGSNGGGGGFGGFQWNCGGAGQDPNTRGMPGARLAPPLSARLFFGGGGGGGQQNNGNATAGARGGGIVLILASAVTGTGRILANGANAANTPGNDGAGGGGAGGTLYVFTRTAPTGSLLFRAAGGNGGNVVTPAAHGPGGGGGGGRAFISAAQGSAIVQTPPGNNGTNSNQGGVYGSNPGFLGDDEEGSYVQLAVPATGVDCFRNMTELPAAFSQGELRYLVSRNGGLDWEFWNGLGWVTGARRDNAMDAATLSANIAGFAPNGSFNLRVYLLGDAAFTPAIDRASFVACSCGDGTVSPGEGCDDGNNNAGDGCSAVCAVEPGWTCTGDPSVCVNACGDGLIGAGEECDDGDQVSGDGCSNVCVIEPGFACNGQPSVCNPTCGNGTLQAGEGCDDGNVTPGDGCSAGCLIEPGFGCTGTPSICTPLCGNGALDGGELCDDGNVLSNDGCSPACLVEPGFSCTGTPSVCVANCGNGTLEAGEFCDDDNIVDGDGCSSFCTFEPGWTCVGVPAVCTEDCGDGLVVGAEDCDDGNTVTEVCAYGQLACLVCDGTCQEVAGATSFCGDGVRNAGAGEGCDDGNAAGGDGCSALCAVEAGWICVGTPSNCTELCGDNLVVGAEGCDDGNTTTEACAYGQTNCVVCNATCQSVPGATSFCGDAATDGANGEACDDGNTTTEVCAYGQTTCAVCNAACQLVPGATSLCGDSVIDAANGEGCDDGGAAPGDGCSATCATEAGWLCAGTPSTCTAICGDGLRVGAEACDDGNLTAGDGCSNLCVLEVGWICVGLPDVCTELCGDGLVVGAETCDDGNTVTETCTYGQTSCQVCSATCSSQPGTTSFCGDAAIDVAAGETCDDGNTSDADGCSGVCGVEPGWSCNGTPSVCNTGCGDGIVAGTEACDDGNVADGDGCSASCAEEPGWTCNVAGCFPICGDGLVLGSEGCDDANTTNGDGCSSLCAVEPGWSCAGAPSTCQTGCGDGVVVGVETCDDGNTVTETCDYGLMSCLVCSAGCQEILGPTSFCGDGALDLVNGEGCDDGNLDTLDGCDDLCLVEAGWNCDAGPCVEVCGDGMIVGNEACDAAGNVNLECVYGETACTVCDDTCALVPGQTSFCGDGRTDAAGGEACDDGNTSDGDGCNATCEVETGWTCDPGPCRTVCGDGMVLGLEACDHGGVLTESCNYGQTSCEVCNEACMFVPGTTSYCGDGAVDGDNGEACDDGNAQSGDGCSASCQTEEEPCEGESCPPTPGCGDGMITGAEACDDGNTDVGDGCSPQCQVESGFDCEGTPSQCEPTESEGPDGGIPPAIDGLPDSAQIAGGGCSCSAEPTPSASGTPYLSLLLLGLLLRGRGRVRFVRDATRDRGDACRPRR